MFDPSVKTIGLVGASVRSAAFSLLRAGYQVVCADLFADADLIRHCQVHLVENYPQDFENWLQQVDCDGWLYTGGLENYSEIVGEMAQICPLLGTSSESLIQVRDPMILQEVLVESGFFFPETKKELNDTSAVLLPLEERSDERGVAEQFGNWLGKSYTGSSGSGVGIIDSLSYRQRYIKGIDLSAVFFEEQLLGITEQLIGESWSCAKDFQYCGSIGPWPYSDPILIEIQRIGELLRDKFNLKSWYGVDLIWAENKLWVIEINPRYTASIEIIERIKASTHGCFGKAILFAKSTIKITSELSEYWLQQAESISWPSLADIPKAGTTIETGQPILSLFSEADSNEEVRIDLKRRATRLEQDICNLQHLGVVECE